MKRYDIKFDYDEATMEPNMEGDYVLHNEAATLLAAKDAEIKRLRVAVELVDQLQCNFPGWWYEQGYYECIRKTLVAIEPDCNDCPIM